MCKKKLVKVAIITITNATPNYGNKLQNYAVVQILNKMNISCRTLYNIQNLEYVRSWKHKLKNWILILLKKDDYLIRKKEVIFDRFNKKYLKFTRPIKKRIPKYISNKFDYYLTGSDQVWNPIFYSNNIHWDYMFLQFAPENKRVAYSASIGLSDIPEKYIESFKKYICEIPNVSVREKTGADLIKKLTGREVSVLIDPTMMLTSQEWILVEKKPKGNLSKYILSYFLGNVSSERKRYIHDISIKYGYKIISLNDEKNNPDLLSIGPREFIYLFHHASLICTDSFHGTVFSILFHNPFIVFNREDQIEDMNSRLDTLLNLFDLNDRRDINLKSTDLFNISYKNVDLILNKERKRTYEFLKYAFKLK